ncbi:Uncharacterised protein [Klebsiella oxytoca]|nr:Uncharacterised protein [Klebsiella oxytoca]
MAVANVVFFIIYGGLLLTLKLARSALWLATR